MCSRKTHTVALFKKDLLSFLIRNLWRQILSSLFSSDAEIVGVQLPVDRWSSRGEQRFSRNAAKGCLWRGGRRGGGFSPSLTFGRPATQGRVSSQWVGGGSASACCCRAFGARSWARSASPCV